MTRLPVPLHLAFATFLPGPRPSQRLLYSSAILRICSYSARYSASCTPPHDRTKGSMTISMPLGILMPHPLTPGASRSLEYLLSRDKLSILYVDLFHSVDFPLLVELNGGFNIDVLSFGLVE